MKAYYYLKDKETVGDVVKDNARIKRGESERYFKDQPNLYSFLYIFQQCVFNISEQLFHPIHKDWRDKDFICVFLYDRTIQSVKMHQGRNISKRHSRGASTILTFF